MGERDGHTGSLAGLGFYHKVGAVGSLRREVSCFVLLPQMIPLLWCERGSKGAKAPTAIEGGEPTVVH